jgi:hypothetical protein
MSYIYCWYIAVLGVLAGTHQNHEWTEAEVVPGSRVPGVLFDVNVPL